MEIPITDKFWCQSKFDENFNETSYIDNKGTSFEYIDPIKSTLKFYKNNDINISQELLNNIKNIKSDDPKEQVFLKIFSDLKLIYESTKCTDILFFSKLGHKDIIMALSLNDGYLYIKDERIWETFRFNYIHSDYDDLEMVKEFINTNMKKHFKISNTIPIK